jgi:hypothetical protein
MNNRFVFLLLTSLCLAYCGRRGDNEHSERKSPGDSVTYVMVDSSDFKLKSNDALVNLITIYADSINNAGRSGELPLFLKDAQLDYDLSSFSYPHSPAPVRKRIFDSVTDCKSLKMIITSKNPTYQIHPEKEDGIDVKYLNFSMRELAMMRYKELNCN